jgi:hypothetical protein
MRRISVLAVLIVALVGLVAFGRSPGTGAQDGTPTAGMAGHPLVGTWIVNDPTGSPSLTAFTADGVVTDVETEGGAGLGSWKPTGERTAAFTLVIVIADPQFSATIQINATVEIDATGNSGTADYTYTAVLPDGTVAESGSGSVTIARLPVQGLDAKGTPIAGFPTWNPNQDQGGAEASPAA